MKNNSEHSIYDDYIIYIVNDIYYVKIGNYYSKFDKKINEFISISKEEYNSNLKNCKIL